MKFVIDQAIPFIEGVLEPYAEVVYRRGEDICAEDVRDADALVIRTRTRCNAALLDGSRVRLIATATIGFDHIDLDYCRTHGIEVSTAAGCNARGVLQWVAATLALLAEHKNFRPEERTIGIVGVGNVGRLVKEYAKAWGFRTVCCDPPREEREHCGFVGLDEVLRTADIVTLHVPLDDSTRHLLNHSNIALLRPDTIVINASRGEVVESEALLLRGDVTCALDVWEHEPHIDKRLLHKAFVATPHIAGYSAEGKANAAALSVRALADRFGLPLGHWYPSGISPTTPRDIGWSDMCRTIRHYCDLARESRELKSHTEEFESLRNNYHYRNEYF